MRSWYYLFSILAIHSALRLARSDENSGAVRCPCANNPATSWEFTLEQAVSISDVVLMGKIVNLHEGMRGTMNATLSLMIAYKGRNLRFLSRIDRVTNFEKDSSREMSLFFLAEEPAGNLALQCMAPLLALNSAGNLKSLLDFVREVGMSKSTCIYVVACESRPLTAPLCPLIAAWRGADVCVCVSAITVDHAHILHIPCMRHLYWTMACYVQTDLIPSNPLQIFEPLYLPCPWVKVFFQLLIFAYLNIVICTINTFTILRLFTQHDAF